MGKIKVEHYAAAVIIVGKRILLIRELGKDDFPITGFHFPGGKAKKEGQLKAALAEALKKKYGAKVKIVDSISPLASIENGRKVVIHGFLCEMLSRFAFPAKHFQSIYSSFDELPSLYLDSLDRKLAEKVALFYPLYAQKRRYLKLSEKEKGEARFYLESLFYYRDLIPAKEISDFSLLLEADCSIKQIRSAYLWILDLYGIDVNQYLDIVEYQARSEK